VDYCTLHNLCVNLCFIHIHDRLQKRRSPQSSNSHLINLFASLPESTTEGKKGLALILDEAITWARQTSRQHLAQSLSLSLASHHLAMKQYRAALTLLSQLTPELKRLDDKHLLTTIHLLSSLTYHRLHNLPKAKAELTSARTAAGSVYVGQGVQARLDLMSGVVNAEDGDWKTAYSYFFESFEGLCAVLEQEEKGGKGAMGDGFGGGGGSLVVDWGMAVGSSGGSGAGMQALTALKYMLLCKIMLNAAEDVTTLLSVKLAAKYADHREVESMKAVARAHANRNLGEFRKALKDYREEFSQDPIVKHHLAALFDRLLEQNLLRIVEPYSVVEISYIASHVELSVQEVEGKLSQMILDKVLDGVLDQGRGCLVLFDSPEKEEGYEDAVKMIAEVGRVVESLWGKAIRA